MHRWNDLAPFHENHLFKFYEAKFSKNAGSNKCFSEYSLDIKVKALNYICCEENVHSSGKHAHK